MPKSSKKGERPRWFNQSYIVFLALRQAGKPLHRPDLINATLKLDKKLAKERKLPTLFKGKTPSNTCSGILTTNANGYFKSEKPPGSKSTIFSLAFEPCDFNHAVSQYNLWVKELIEVDWPIFFAEITNPNKYEECANRYNAIMKRRMDEIKKSRPVLQARPLCESPPTNNSSIMKHELNTRSRTKKFRARYTESDVFYSNADDYFDDDIGLLGFEDHSTDMKSSHSEGTASASLELADAAKGNDTPLHTSSKSGDSTAVSDSAYIKDTQDKALPQSNSEQVASPTTQLPQSAVIVTAGQTSKLPASKSPSSTEAPQESPSKSASTPDSSHSKNGSVLVLEDSEDEDFAINPDDELNDGDFKMKLVAAPKRSSPLSMKKIDPPLSLTVPTSILDLLYTQTSSLGPNAGLGCFTRYNIEIHTIIGFYFGVPMTEDEYDSLKDNVGIASSFSIRYKNTVLDATDDQGMPFKPDNPEMFCPCHYINENAAKVNCVFLDGAAVNQIWVVTTRAVRAGEEMFVVYGSEVDRTGWGGEAASSNDQQSVQGAVASSIENEPVHE